MGNAAAVSDDIKAVVPGLKFFIDCNLHVVELDFHAIQECVVIGGAGSNFVQGVNHFNQTVQNSLWQNQT